MTLHDLFLLVKRYLRWVIVVPLACAVLAGGFVAIKDMTKDSSYSASASVSVADLSATLSTSNLMLALASAADDVAAAHGSDSLSITTKSDAAAQSVLLTATAGSADEAISAANAAAEDTAEAFKIVLAEQGAIFGQEAESALGGIADQSQSDAGVKAAALEACLVSVSAASKAAASGSTGIVKYAAVGLVGGLFVVVLALALFDAIKRPIKSRNDITRATELPVLNGSGGSAGVDLTRAGLMTFCGDQLESICVVDEGGAAQQFTTRLAAAFASSSEREIVLNTIGPLVEDASGYFVAQDADAVVVCVAKWKGTIPGLLMSLEELKLSKAKVAGIVLV